MGFEKMVMSEMARKAKGVRYNEGSGKQSGSESLSLISL